MLRSMRSLAIAGSLCAVPACQYRSAFEVSRHALIVGENGEARRVNDTSHVNRGEGVSRGKLTTVELEESIGRLMSDIRQSAKDTITVYVHGGLVSHSSGYRKAAKLGPELLSAGHFPVFIIWEAGWQATVADHLKSVRQGQEWTRFTGYTSAPLVVFADLGRAVSRLPLGIVQQLGDYCTTWKGIVADSVRRENGDHECGFSNDRAQALRSREISKVLADSADPLTIGLRQYHSNFNVGTLRLASGIVTSVPKFIISGPLIDGFGGGAWQNMLRRTQTMFRRREDMLRNIGISSGYQAPSGAVSVLIDSLRSMITGDSISRGRSRSVVLVGHSMGAIVVTRILRESPNLPVDKIYMLAAAATMRQVEDAVVPFMTSPAHQSTRLFMGTLHPRVEVAEMQTKYLDLVPRGSLLEWIDDALSNPDTPLDRTAGKWSNIAAMHYVFPNEIRGRIRLKGFGYRDIRDKGTFLFSGINAHGSFGDPRFAFWNDASWCLFATADACKLGSSSTITR